ncbi:MAG: phosphatase PAP2 family protein [Flavobacteriales bacterium]|nr:phosphatase PAP2 family protein [Flavobacteriales bacterium]
MRPLKPFLLSVLLGLTILGQVYSQEAESPYNFNWKRELIYASGSGLIAAGGVFADYQIQPLTAAQINALDPYALPGLDMSAVHRWNPKADLASDIMLYGSITLPAFLMINKRARKDFLAVGFIYAETALLTLGVTELAKTAVRRPRPFVYNKDVDVSYKTDRDARLSFFSGHTSITAALCFTTAKVFSDYSDNETHKALVWTGAILFPAAVGMLRYEAGKHFPTDIIAGYIIGGTIGYLVPWLHHRKPLVKGLSIVPFSNTQKQVGVYLSYQL